MVLCSTGRLLEEVSLPGGLAADSRGRGVGQVAVLGAAQVLPASGPPSTLGVGRIGVPYLQILFFFWPHCAVYEILAPQLGVEAGSATAQS